MQSRERLKQSETMSDLYIIKLGGSAITEKEGNKFEAREKTLERIASEIKKASAEKGFSLLIVHGVGPFGHTNVKEYDINNGINTERQKEGLEKTKKDCAFLNKIVVEKLKEAGIHAVSFNPGELILQENKKIVEFDINGIEKALGERKVPVLFGQMVPDKKLVASVCSGDASLAFLAKKLKPKKVFLGTDVAGVFTADPKENSEAERIPLIDKKNFEEIIKKVGEAKTVDVTQGMKGKLLKLREQLKGTESFIFDANQEGNFYRALAGKKIEGTEIRL